MTTRRCFGCGEKREVGAEIGKRGRPICKSCQAEGVIYPRRAGDEPQRKGYRRCEKCHERKRYPAEFARTKSGEVSHQCKTCHRSAGRKRCEQCGRKRRVGTEISAHANGRVCYECQRESNRKRQRDWIKAKRQSDPEYAEILRERAREYKRQNPDVVLANSQASKARIRLDPERGARVRENARMAYRERQERAGRVMSAMRHRPVPGGYAPPPPSNHSGTMLPVEPLVDWLKYEFPDWSITEIAGWIGVDDSHLNKILSGQQEAISETTVDRIVVGADCPHLLSLLYPASA